MKKLFCFLIFVLIIHLTIDIENSKVLGRKVATLVNEQLQPGTPAYRSLGAGRYEAEFISANYPSGVYYYQLVVNS